MSKSFTEVFCQPIVFEKIERSVWPPSWLGHAPFALWLMQNVRPETLVELGTHTGNSFAAFCQGAKFLNFRPSCYAVDTWEGDPHAGLYGEEVFADVKQYFEKNYPSFTHLVRKTFDDALNNFADGSIDLLNIDGYHTYEATKDNFDTWLPKMSSKGVILIHDTNVRTADFGAWKFWEEIEKKYPSFNFLHSHGLGVVAVGSQVPESIRFLAQSDSAQIDQVRVLFSTLGAAPVLRAENARLADQIEALEKNSLEAHRMAERERDNSAAWMAFVHQHLGKSLEEAKEKLELLSQSNLEAMSFKLFVERRLGNTAQAAEESLLAERAESLKWKNFVQGHIADTTEAALTKLVSLGDSNQLGLIFTEFVRRNLGQSVEEATGRLESLQLQHKESEAWRNLVSSRLGETLEEAERKLTELLNSAREMQSPAHKMISFLNQAIQGKKS